MKRRRFLQLSATIAGITPILKSCNNRKKIPGKIVGASAAIGHILRNGKPQQTPISSIEKQVVIIGGGISGLSAARWLHKSGVKDFVLLDLDKQMGGNAAYGTNETSAFSWGAHYITIPNNSLQEYLDFLQECNVINGFNEKGLPIINEYYLCHDPQERLYIHGSWQDGLIPNIGLKDADKQELLAFLALMESYKTIRGNDGKEAFAIPIDNSSNDKTYTILDTITMKEWLLQKNFNSEYVHWYVNYCTKDDFGTNYNIISAWVGIHYFASRKGIAANASSHDVITWPSGNAWLVNELKKNMQTQMQNNALATEIISNNQQMEVRYYNTVSKQVHSIQTNQIILATPQFINKKLLPNEKYRNAIISEKLHYVPWMVANLHTENLVERNGAPLSWDNVLYNSESLGYIKANHQLLSLSKGSNNLTYYLPLTNHAPTIERQHAYDKKQEDWADLVMNDLKVVHPNIEEATKQIDVMVWGHAMAQPLPNLIHSDIRKKLQQSINNKIHFAHTDLAGISIFEEAFYQGIHAAKKVIEQLHNESNK